MKRRARLAVLALTVLLIAGCRIRVGYPHACDNHGGTRVVVKGLNYCRDGRIVGDGWLWVHHREVAP